MTWHAYDYALLRLIPDVTCEAGVTVGVVLHSRTARFLGFSARLDAARLAPLWPAFDYALADAYLDAFAAVADARPGSGPIGLLPPSERFHWLTAPRSTVLQPGPVRAGRSPDVAGAFAGIVERVL